MTNSLLFITHKVDYICSLCSNPAIAKVLLNNKECCLCSKCVKIKKYEIDRFVEVYV